MARRIMLHQIALILVFFSKKLIIVPLRKLMDGVIRLRQGDLSYQVQITSEDEMGGKETIKELIQIDKQVKGIASSGYSNDPVMSEFKQYGFKGIITKPYNLDELRETMTRVVSGRSS